MTHSDAAMDTLPKRAMVKFDQLVAWFAPAQAQLDEGQHSAGRMLVYICLINLVFCLLYAITSVAIGFYIGAFLMTAGTLVLLACLFLFRASGLLRLTINLYMANCAFVAIMGCSFFSGGLRSPVVPWFTLVPVAAVLLLGYSLDALIWGVVCLAIPLGYGVASLQGYHFPQLYRLEFETLFGMICIGGLVAVLFLFALTFDHNSRLAMQQVLDSRKELERLALRQERQAERGRILRNMHDGVGSHISSAMRQLQGPGGDSEPCDRQKVVQTLRDALDQLKLSIDSMHLTAGDVAALLANMRYRLGSRFAGMGTELQWAVELLPICPGLDDSAMSELQFMLFEALSNVLQHANARVLRIEAYARPRVDAEPAAREVLVRVVDDGCGFDLADGQHNGLATMRERAATIGARLRISSAPGRTVVEIQLDA